MVTGLDIAIGRIVKALMKEGLYDNSIILFSSDVSDYNYKVRRNHGKGGVENLLHKVSAPYIPIVVISNGKRDLSSLPEAGEAL